MQLVVLGSGTSVFHAQRASAAFWLETDRGSILLDCSAEAAHRMAQENLDWMNLDAIWISHLHLDHCGGLASFLFGIKHAPGSERRQKPLRIFACEGIEKFMRAIDESHDYGLLRPRFPVELHEIESSDSERSFEILPGMRSDAMSTPHRPESLAVRITDSTGATVVYTSDTGYSASIAEFARGVDLLILECSFHRDKPVKTHLELSDAMRIAQLAEPKRVLLTHLYPEWNGVDLETEAKKLWDGETIEARDGLRLTISL